MKIGTFVIAVVILAGVFVASVQGVERGYMRMPPAFSMAQGPVEVLANYPLGVIEKRVAFAHHGKANKEFMLPNGRLGWLYDVGQKEWHRTYTLVFGKDGVVIDVLYYDHARFAKYGLTALQLQSVKPRTERPALGPGPGE